MDAWRIRLVRVFGRCGVRVVFGLGMVFDSRSVAGEGESRSRCFDSDAIGSGFWSRLGLARLAVRHGTARLLVGSQ